MTIPDFPCVVAFPGDLYPNTEEILQISDALICDWSSIAFDYLLLDRPTYFLDVPPPFRKGLALGANYRFGPVVLGLEQLVAQLESWLKASSNYWNFHRTLRRDRTSVEKVKSVSVRVDLGGGRTIKKKK